MKKLFNRLNELNINDCIIREEIKKIGEFLEKTIIIDDCYNEEYDRVRDYLRENGENILDYELSEIIDLVIDEAIA